MRTRTLLISIALLVPIGCNAVAPFSSQQAPSAAVQEEKVIQQAQYLQGGPKLAGKHVNPPVQKTALEKAFELNERIEKLESQNASLKIANNRLVKLRTQDQHAILEAKTQIELAQKRQAEAQLQLQAWQKRLVEVVADKNRDDSDLDSLEEAVSELEKKILSGTPAKPAGKAPVPQGLLLEQSTQQQSSMPPLPVQQAAVSEPEVSSSGWRAARVQ